MRVVKRKRKQYKESSIAYSGTVQVSIVKDNKVIKEDRNHNSGTRRLFEFIAKCLANQYESTYSPRYIRFFHVVDPSDDIDNLSGLEPLTDAILISSSTFKVNENAATAQLTFNVPGNVFTFSSGGSLDGNNVPNVVALYSFETINRPEAQLATVKLDSSVVGSITQDVNLIVVWELSVMNTIE